MVKFLGQEEAIKVDEELFNEYKFSVDQLMELAGLSVASTIASVYTSKKDTKVLIICGPGNNGGDGMVAARHLRLFGFEDVTLLNARKPNKDLFCNLIRQAELNQVKISYDASPYLTDASLGLVVDALFGFSFKPPVRPDFEPLMEILTHAQSKKIPVVSVDIPSGWDVEKGPPENKSLYFMPDTLVSLTAPKLCAKYFTGPNHYLGGRFVPKGLEEKYSMNLPPYPGIECIVRL
jgi:NAD(P)H-hydrate epimerase